MATTWGTFRSTVRSLLKDTTGDVLRWSDAELLDYANLAIDDLSVNVPLTKLVALPMTPVSAIFELPADLCRVDYLLFTQDETITILGEVKPRQGDQWNEPAQGYMIHWPEEDRLTVLGEIAGYTLDLYYSAYRPHMTGADSVLPFGTQRWMEQSCAFYICYLAHMREGVGRASLEQWSAKPENIVGNPLLVEARAWLDAYQRTIREGRPAANIRTYQ
jgi:hypothetical protein